MTEGGRMGLMIGGGIALAAGIGGGLIAAGVITNPFAPSQPSNWPTTLGKWPTTASQAHQDVIALDAAWFSDWLDAGQPTNAASWTSAMTQLHLAATLIRSSYPGSAPAAGYACSQLVALGALPSTFPCPD